MLPKGDEVVGVGITVGHARWDAHDHPFHAGRLEEVEGCRRCVIEVDGVDELGAQVKDLDIGLIDFLTRYHGREVCLCWKLGEHGIRFWHSQEEGFKGRKPIDAEFLENHHGDAPN